MSNLRNIILSGAIIGSSTVEAATLTYSQSAEYSEGSWGFLQLVHRYEITVKEGDTLTSIARQIETQRKKANIECDSPVTWEDLYQQNKDRLANPDLIQPGQKLKLSIAGRHPAGVYSLI